MTRTTGAQDLGRYVLEARIARGGMGEVFRAAAIGVDGFRKPVVIKRVLTHAATRELSEMFVAEAKLMTRLAHPNIVEVFDFGKSDDGAYFLVMELVDGLDVRAFADSYRAAGQPMPIALALHIAREALRGLSFAHTQALGQDKLVHRDISPGNILLSLLGEVKVADFGVALVAGPEASRDDRMIVGKPSYMAPEQARGDAIDARADLFSLGVVLYELVTGRLPFAEDAFARATRDTPATPRDLLADRADAPPSLAALLLRALADEPSARYEDARSMLRALDALRSDGVHPATADDLAEAVSERRRTHEPEQVIVIGRDIAERTRVERGEGGTSFTLSVEEPSAPAEHHTERLTDDAAPAPLTPAPLAPAKPSRRGLWLGLAAAGVAAAVGFVVTRIGAPTKDTPNEPATISTAITSGSEAVAPASPTTLDSAPLAPIASSPRPQPSGLPISRTGVVSPAASSQPSVPGCVGTIKIMASHGWAVRGGPTAAEAPGVYSWRCGAYNLSATSRLDDQKRAASVVIREDKQAVVDLR